MNKTWVVVCIHVCFVLNVLNPMFPFNRQLLREKAE